jgi:hypothetical protein
LLLVDLDDEGDALLVEMFEMMFEAAAVGGSSAAAAPAAAAAAGNLPMRVEFHFKEIMATVFDELDSISQPLLDSLLTKVISPYREDNRRAAAMADDVLQRCASRLEQPIADFLVKALVRGQAEETGSALTDAKHQRALIVELARVAPSTLLQVLPQVALSLRAASAEVRAETCAMLIAIFNAHPNTLARDYHTLFDLLLQRLADADADVRLLLVLNVKNWLLLFPAQARAESFQTLLEGRVTDADDRVRAACVQQLCDAALEQPECITAPMVLAVAKRACDRRETISRDAVQRLALLFRTHCLEHWRSARELPEHSRKFLFLPKRLVAACTQDAFRAALIVEEALDEVMLDHRRFSPEERTRCFVGFFAALDARSQSALVLKMLVPKQFVQHGVRQLLALREARKADPATDRAAAAHALALRVARFLPDTTIGACGAAGIGAGIDADSVERCAERLVELCVDHPDNHAARFLATCAAPTSDRAVLATAKKELLRVVGARHNSAALKEFTRRLQQRMCMSLLTADSVPHLVQEALTSFAADKFVLCHAALALLSALANKFADVVAPHMPTLLQLLEQHHLAQKAEDEEAEEAELDEASDDESDEEDAGGSASTAEGELRVAEAACNRVASRAKSPIHILMARALEVVALVTHSASARAVIERPVVRRLTAALRVFVLRGTVAQAESAVRALLHLNGQACAHSTEPPSLGSGGAVTAGVGAPALGPFAGPTGVGSSLFPIALTAQNSSMALQAPPVPVAVAPTAEVSAYFGELLDDLVTQLVVFTAPPAAAAKPAAAAAKKGKQAAKQPAPAARHTCTRVNALLSTHLAALAILALEVPHLFAEGSTRILRFVQSQLLVARARRAGEVEALILAKEAGLRVLVNYLFAATAETWQSKGEAVPIFKLLLQLIEHAGRAPNSSSSSFSSSMADSDEQLDESEDCTERDRVHLAAANGFLDLCTTQRFERMMLPVHHEALFAVALTESHAVRAGFVEHAGELFVANRLRFRYTCILAMTALAAAEDADAASSGSSSSSSGGAALATAARALRDAARKRLQLVVLRQHQLSAYFVQKRQAVPQEFYPEHAIGDLIHALAHRPSMRVDDENVLRQYARPIGFFLEALLDTPTSKGAGAAAAAGCANFPILSAILTTIRNSAVDACPLVPEHTTNALALAELAHLMLIEKLRARKWDTTPFHEPIRLRVSLFSKAEANPHPKKLIALGFDWHDPKDRSRGGGASSAAHVARAGKSHAAVLASPSSADEANGGRRKSSSGSALKRSATSSSARKVAKAPASGGKGKQAARGGGGSAKKGKRSKTDTWGSRDDESSEEEEEADEDGDDDEDEEEEDQEEMQDAEDEEVDAAAQSDADEDDESHGERDRRASGLATLFSSSSSMPVAAAAGRSQRTRR